MRIFRIGLALAVVLALSCGAAWSAILTWKSFEWDTQPIAGYTSGTVKVDTATDQLWTTSSAVTKNTSFRPYSDNPGEKISVAKCLYTGDLMSGFRARVYDPGTAASWSIVVKNSTGKIIDYGIRSWANGKINGQIYDGSTWAGNNYIYTRLKNGEYWDTTAQAQPGGAVKFDTAYYNQASGNTDNFSWTTPSSFGMIEDIYLMAATTGTAYTTFKWTNFETWVPEPSSLLALLSGLPILGFALRRRN